MKWFLSFSVINFVCRALHFEVFPEWRIGVETIACDTPLTVPNTLALAREYTGIGFQPLNLS